MAALFLADVAPQTGCILPLWIVLCVFVESPIGAISSPPSSPFFARVLVVVFFFTFASSSSSSSSFASTFPSLSLRHPSSILLIDRQKKPRGYREKRAAKELLLASLHGFTIPPPPKLEHFFYASCQRKGKKERERERECSKYLEVIPRTCAKSTDSFSSLLLLLFLLLFYPLPARSNEFPRKQICYKSAFTISMRGSAFIIAITTKPLRPPTSLSPPPHPVSRNFVDNLHAAPVFLRLITCKRCTLRKGED